MQEHTLCKLDEGGGGKGGIGMRHLCSGPVYYDVRQRDAELPHAQMHTNTHSYSGSNSSRRELSKAPRFIFPRTRVSVGRLVPHPGMWAQDLGCSHSPVQPTVPGTQEESKRAAATQRVPMDRRCGGTEGGASGQHCSTTESIISPSSMSICAHRKTGHS